jgi:hypothetical protein
VRELVFLHGSRLPLHEMAGAAMPKGMGPHANERKVSPNAHLPRPKDRARDSPVRFTGIPPGMPGIVPRKLRETAQKSGMSRNTGAT